MSSLVAGALPARAATPTELFFSEYIEGSSNNKALEIYNDTGAPVNLGTAGYNVQMAFNGNATPSLTINLTGTVASGDVFVLAHSAANATILAQADQTNGSGWFNGDDAVILRRGTTVIDVIGQIGVDPGTEWGSGQTSTADNTLRRKDAVTTGDTNGSDAFDPAVEWDGFAIDTFDGLGWHITPPEVAPVVVSTDPVAGANTAAPYGNIRITFSEPVDVTDSWFTIECGVSGAHPAAVSGGPTTYTLDPQVDFGQGETCRVTVVAAQVTDRDDRDPPDSLAADYIWSFRVAACGDQDTLISAIQGIGATSPMVGDNVTFQGVVTAIRPGLSGFFVQEEAADQDADPSTSEGVFVRTNPPAGTAPGDVVQVSGTVAEFTGSGSSQTQIGGGATVLDCGDAAVPEPAVLEFPFANASYI
jgi:predicted extracellular nuclease